MWKKILLIFILFNLTNATYNALPWMAGTGRRFTTNQPYSSDMGTNARICAQQGYCGNLNNVDQFTLVPVISNGIQYLECNCIN